MNKINLPNINYSFNKSFVFKKIFLYVLSYARYMYIRLCVCAGVKYWLRVGQSQSVPILLLFQAVAADPTKFKSRYIEVVTSGSLVMQTGVSKDVFPRRLSLIPPSHLLPNFRGLVDLTGDISQQ